MDADAVRGLSSAHHVRSGSGRPGGQQLGLTSRRSCSSKERNLAQDPGKARGSLSRRLSVKPPLQVTVTEEHYTRLAQAGAGGSRWWGGGRRPHPTHKD